MIKYLAKEDFNSEISNGITLVDFYATWCGPCKMLEPVLEQISNERSPYKILKVDIDEHEDLTRSFGIMSVPTMIIFKDGKQIKSITGFLPKDEILKELQKAE